MSEDERPKSAYEIAMEKLRARGDFEEKTLSEDQKAEIAEIRSRYRAKIAESEIQHQSLLREASTMEEVETLRTELARVKRQLESEMEEKVEKVRSAEP